MRYYGYKKLKADLWLSFQKRHVRNSLQILDIGMKVKIKITQLFNPQLHILDEHVF